MKRFAHLIGAGAVVNALLLSALLAACAGQTASSSQNGMPSDSTAAAARADSAQARTYAYACDDGFRFTARVASEAAWVHLPDTTARLPHVAAASGAKYEGAGLTYWSKGDSALVETPRGSHTGCAIDRRESIWADAALRGADFRAVGQEPGWHLEIARGDSITLVADYGERRVVTPAPEPHVDRQAGRTTYRAETEAHVLTVEIIEESCRDVMSGERFEATVAVTLDGQTYRGCGRALR